MIRTVLGDREIPEGSILVHEHLQINLAHNKSTEVILGAAEEPDIAADLAYTAATYGLRAVADLGTVGAGRNVTILRQIARDSGVAVIAATGYYWEPARPILAGMSEDQLVAFMIREIESGADDTDIRCGVIKIGTSNEAPSADTERLFRAAAGAAKIAGVSIITHTSRPDQARWHVDILGAAGMDMSRVLISHMHKAETIAEIARIAASGAFVGFDQVGFNKGKPMEQVADFTVEACAAGLIDHLVVSSDIARRSRLMKNGGTGFTTVFARFLDLLRARGVDESQIKTLLHDNPRKILSLRGHAPVSAAKRRGET